MGKKGFFFILFLIIFSFAGIISAIVFFYKLRPEEPVPEKEFLFKKLTREEAALIVDRGSTESLKKALSKSLIYLGSLRDGELLSWGNGKVEAWKFKKSLLSFYNLLEKDLSSQEFQEEFLKNFNVYKVGQTLVTGYFQPELNASKKPDSRYPYPLYGIPGDLVRIRLSDFDSSLPARTLWGRVEGNRFIPYYSRKKIDTGDASIDAPVLAWLSSPVDGLMLHIQGSGILRFEDGSKGFIHYAANNGRLYGSMGKWLIKKGYLASHEADWPGIRAWADKNPGLFQESLISNPRYIFFKWEKQGPIGEIGQVIVPYRSVALDEGVFPKGGLFFLTTHLPTPDVNKASAKDFSSFVLFQDVGSAIKGVKRLDLYCGSGEEAGYVAGRLKAEGSLYLFMLKGLEPE